MAFFRPTPNIYLKGGGLQLMVWNVATGESFITPMVLGGLPEEARTTRMVGTGQLQERDATYSYHPIVTGAVESQKIRQWANRGGTPALINAILLGRAGWSYQFLENVPCIYRPIFGDFGGMSGDMLMLTSGKFAANVYEDVTLIPDKDFEDDWTALTGTGRSSSYDPTTGVWTINVTTAGTNVGLYVDKIIPATSKNLYFSISCGTLTGAGATAVVRATPLDFDEVDTVAFGSESNANQTTAITSGAREELTVAMPSDAWGVRLAVLLTQGGADASMSVSLPMFTSKPYESVVPAVPPLPEFGLTGEDDSGSTDLTVDGARSTATDDTDYWTLTIPDEAYVGTENGGLVIVLKTDNDWTQP